MSQMVILEQEANFVDTAEKQEPVAEPRVFGTCRGDGFSYHLWLHIAQIAVGLGGTSTVPDESDVSVRPDKEKGVRFDVVALPDVLVLADKLILPQGRAGAAQDLVSRG